MTTILTSLVQKANNLFSHGLNAKIYAEQALSTEEARRVATAIRMLKRKSIDMESIREDALRHYGPILSKYAGNATINELGEDKWFCRDAGIDYNHPPENIGEQIREGIVYAIANRWIK